MGTNRLTLLSILVAAPFWVSSAEAQTYPAPDEVGNCSLSQYANCDSSPDQDQLDMPGTGGAQDGNWSDLSGGVVNRPFVQRLAVVNGGVETVLLENGTTTSSLSNTAGSIGVVVSPLNLCDSTEDPSDPNNNCYSSPNRIQVTLVYRKSVGQVGYNLSFPNDGNQGTLSGNAVPLQSFDGSTSITIDAETTIDLTLALNTLGQSLRWTWLNGIPSFWRLNSLGGQAATLRLKFKPAVQPSIHYPSQPGSSSCTAIPVTSCDVSRSNSDWLGATMVLSLDETLSSGMTGALFATEGAIIGSVDAATDSTSGLPGLIYGLASSHFDYLNVARSATLRAFVPAAGLVQVLGFPSFTEGVGSGTNPSTVISAQRTDASSTSTNAFQVWNESVHGENGLLVTISGITFSAPQYRVKSKTGTPKVPTVRLARNKYSFTLQGSTSGVLKSCKTKPCTVTVYRAPASVYSPVLTRMSRKVAGVAGNKLTSAFSIKKTSTVTTGTKLLVVVTSSRNKVLTSTPVTLQ
jgi:hypothetical protein